MKFLLVTKPSQLHIGTFILNIENRQWCFRYSDDFIMNGESVLPDFPEITKTYGHDACVKWLSARVGSVTPNNKGIRLAEAISLRGNKRIDELEIQTVH